MYKNVMLHLACAVALVGLVAAAPASGQSASFYEGKNITLLIGYSPGGGYDTYARTLARHLGKHIPGNPNIVPKNMPGAGSLTLTNYLYNVAPKDGTEIGTIGRGIPMEPMLGGEGTRFKPIEFNWLGSLNNEVSICAAWHTNPVKDWQDLQQQQMVVGGTGSGADTDTFPIVLRNLLGAKLKLISGYPGGSDILLAMERGEVGGRCGWSWSSVKSRKADWLKEKKINILVQLSLAKHPDLPNVPLVMDLTDDPEKRSILKLIFARQVMGRPYVAPPGVPKDRVRMLRDAFMATVSDPAFMADARKSKLEVNAISGDEVEELLVEMYSYPEPLIAKASDAVSK